MEQDYLEKIIQLEAERRTKMLGSTVGKAYDYVALVIRSKITGIAVKTLWTWWQAQNKTGIEGLKPTNWGNIEKKNWENALRRREVLGEFADKIEIKAEEYKTLADKHAWSLWKAKRELSQYRNEGLIGLTSVSRKKKEKDSDKKKLPRPYVTLDEMALKVIEQRYQLLGPLAEKCKREKASNEDVETRVKMLGEEGTKVTARTLWSYIKLFRDSGLEGLAPKERVDKGKQHNISPTMQQVIKGYRLSKKDCTIREVLDEACKRARVSGEPEPSEWHVRKIVESIRKAVKRIADGRKGEFNNHNRLTYPYRYEDTPSFQIDHTPIDVLNKDLRDNEFQTKSGETRLYMITIVDSESRLWLGYKLTYDHPDRFDVAAVIRDALINFGIPAEMRIDNGWEFKAELIVQLVRELKFKLHVCDAYHPWQKGIVERIQETVKTRCLARLEGYTSSNVVERNPTVKAKHTAAEIDDIISKFREEYNAEVHSATGMTPLEYWNEFGFTSPVDKHELDILLKEAEWKKVSKKGIHYATRIYWHQDLGSLVGEYVLIRVAASSYRAPDDIDVFWDNQRICTAWALDSEVGKTMPNEIIAVAQRDQIRGIRQEINASRKGLKDIDKQIEELNDSVDKTNTPEITIDQVDTSEVKPIENKPVKSTPVKKNKNVVAPKGNLFDRINAIQEEKEGEKV